VIYNAIPKRPPAQLQRLTCLKPQSRQRRTGFFRIPVPILGLHLPRSPQPIESAQDTQLSYCQRPKRTSQAPFIPFCTTNWIRRSSLAPGIGLEQIKLLELKIPTFNLPREDRTAKAMPPAICLQCREEFDSKVGSTITLEPYAGPPFTSANIPKIGHQL
jgi:hypothetical protein